MTQQPSRTPPLRPASLAKPVFPDSGTSLPGSEPGLPSRVLPGQLDGGAAQPLSLRRERACVWRIFLPDFAATALQARLRSWLDAGEIARLERCRAPRHARQFLLGRAILRRLLGAFLDCEPAAVALARDEHGKPQLDPPGQSVDLHFSVSHSGDWVYLALARGMRPGVDIERIDKDTDCLAIAARFFSAREQAALAQSGAVVRDFYRCWVRKESFLKACAGGLGFGLDRFSVVVGEHPAPAPIVVDTPPGPGMPAQAWFNHHLAAPTGYVAALALPGARSCLSAMPFPGHTG